MNESPSKKGLNLPFPIFYGAERGRGRWVGLILFINLISYAIWLIVWSRTPVNFDFLWAIKTDGWSSLNLHILWVEFLFHSNEQNLKTERNFKYISRWFPDPRTLPSFRSGRSEGTGSCPAIKTGGEKVRSLQVGLCELSPPACPYARKI